VAQESRPKLGDQFFQISIRHSTPATKRDGNSSAPIAFSVISTKGRNLLAWNCTRLPTPDTAFSLCAGISGNGGQVLSEQDLSLAQTGYLYSTGYYSHVAPGRAHSFEMTIRAELLQEMKPNQEEFSNNDFIADL
jgi:hypothetical protein